MMRLLLLMLLVLLMLMLLLLLLWMMLLLLMRRVNHRRRIWAKRVWRWWRIQALPLTAAIVVHLVMLMMVRVLRLMESVVSPAHSIRDEPNLSPAILGRLAAHGAALHPLWLRRIAIGISMVRSGRR
jgi:TRAP-type C4-dicarboxylate transport system permease small subunit